MPVDKDKMKALALAATPDMPQYLSPGAPGNLLRFAIDCNPAAVLELLAENDKLDQERDELRAVVEAARRLVKAKGRYHTELNYKALAAALDDLGAHSKAGKP